MARNLRDWRVKRGMSQEALSEKAGLTRVFIARVETCADTVSLDNIEKLAEALKVDLIDLLLP